MRSVIRFGQDTYVSGRQVGEVKEAASNLEDRVMGSDDDDYSRLDGWRGFRQRLCR